MVRWKNKHKEFKRVLNADEMSETLGPFRAEIRRLMEEGNDNSEQGVKSAYRETRATLLNQLRINLALLDAAAHEENILIKK